MFTASATYSKLLYYPKIALLANGALCLSTMVNPALGLLAED